MAKQLKPEPVQLEENLDDAEAFLTAIAARQNLTLEQLEARIEALGDDFAARARTIVERGLMNARAKTLREIKTIDIGFFLQTEPETLPGSQSILTEAQEVSQ